MALVKVEGGGKTFEIDDTEENLAGARAKGYKVLITLTGNGTDTYDIDADDTEMVRAAFDKGYQEFNSFKPRVEKEKVDHGGLASLAQSAASAMAWDQDDKIAGAASGVNALLHGEDYTPAYTETRDKIRAHKQELEEAHPNYSKAGTLIGSAVGPSGMLKAGEALGARLISGAKLGAKIGGVTGFVDSDATDIGDIALDTAGGAVKGAAGMSLMHGVVAPAIGKVAEKGLDAIKFTRNKLGDIVFGVPKEATEHYLEKSTDISPLYKEGKDANRRIQDEFAAKVERDIEHPIQEGTENLSKAKESLTREEYNARDNVTDLQTQKTDSLSNIERKQVALENEKKLELETANKKHEATTQELKDEYYDKMLEHSQKINAAERALDKAEREHTDLLNKYKTTRAPESLADDIMGAVDNTHERVGELSSHAVDALDGESFQKSDLLDSLDSSMRELELNGRAPVIGDGVSAYNTLSKLRDDLVADPSDIVEGKVFKKIHKALQQEAYKTKVAQRDSGGAALLKEASADVNSILSSNVEYNDRMVPVRELKAYAEELTKIFKNKELTKQLIKKASHPEDGKFIRETIAKLDKRDGSNFLEQLTEANYAQGILKNPVELENLKRSHLDAPKGELDSLRKGTGTLKDDFRTKQRDTLDPMAAEIETLEGGLKTLKSGHAESYDAEHTEWQGKIDKAKDYLKQLKQTTTSDKMETLHPLVEAIQKAERKLAASKAYKADHNLLGDKSLENTIKKVGSGKSYEAEKQVESLFGKEGVDTLKNLHTAKQFQGDKTQGSRRTLLMSIIGKFKGGPAGEIAGAGLGAAMDKAGGGMWKGMLDVGLWAGPKYSKVLENAAKVSDHNLAATHLMLYEEYPEYRAKFENWLKENGDDLP